MNLRNYSSHKIFIWVLFIFIALAGFVFLSPQQSEAASYNIDSCDYNANVTGDTYILVADLICTGHGINIGANDVVIDGGGHTLTGDEEATDFGINNSGGFDNITIKNFGSSANSGISKFGRGISFSNSNGSTVENNITNSNTWYGIYLYLSSFNTLQGNTANSNSTGLNIAGPSNTLNGNTTNSNARNGISIGGASNILTNNTANSNNVLYWNSPGIYLVNGNNSTLSGNITNSNNSYGIQVFNSPSVTINNNTTNLNTIYGIFLRDCPSSTVNDNTTNSNRFGIYLMNSGSSSIFQNKLTLNTSDYFDDQVANNTYLDNQSLHNAKPTTLIFNETSATGIKNPGDTVTFTINAKKINGTACANCTNVTLSPSEPLLNLDTNGNGETTGSFIPTRQGTYSLNIRVTDPDGNIALRRYYFFVGPTGTQTSKLFYRGLNPVHGQPYGSDAKSLLLSAPLESETWRCGVWVQNSVDDIPPYPLSYLSSVDSYGWYRQDNDNPFRSGTVGLQRFVTYDTASDQISSSISATKLFSWTNQKFSDLKWTMDYPESWYWLVFKYNTASSQFPYQTSFPATQAETDPASWAAHSASGTADPSYVDFTYQYPTTPAIYSISNHGISVLSATASTNDSAGASIVLGGTGSTDIVLDNFHRPFQGYVTTINSDGKSTLRASSLTGETSINSVKMDITPNTGSLDININFWNVAGNYYKQWTEEGAGATSAGHVIGDLKSNTDYAILVDSVKYGTYRSDALGKINFEYNGSYSRKTFELTAVDMPIFVLSADKNKAHSGEQITYTLKVNNSSLSEMTNVTITSNPLPTNVTYVNNSATNNGSYDSPSRMVKWETIASLSPNSELTYTFQVTVN